jgi:hypothetical protein
VARAVSPWTWGRCLRDHGPNDRLMLLILHTLRTYMDREGFAFPARAALAAGARVHLKTVARHLTAAAAAGWIHFEPRGHAGGQKWRSSTYRATVPDSVVLDEKSEMLADAIVSVHGEAEDTMQSSPLLEGGSAMQSSPLAVTPLRYRQAEDNSTSKVRTYNAKLRTISTKVGVPESLDNSHLEVVISNSRSEEGALTRTAHAPEADSIPRAGRFGETVAMPGLANGSPEGKSASPRPLRIEPRRSSLTEISWLTKMVEAGVSLDIIARSSGSSVSQVQRAVAALAQAGPLRSAL